MTDPLGLIPGSNVQRGASIAPRPSHAQRPGENQGPSFNDVLRAQIDEVNRLQQDADKAIEDVVSGTRDDVDAVMMAKQKADVAFQMLLQVRNKMMDAYEEVKQIRV